MINVVDQLKGKKSSKFRNVVIPRKTSLGQIGGDNLTMDDVSGVIEFLKNKNITVKTITTDEIISTSPVQVKGTVAHDGIDADAPVKVGAKAVSYGNVTTIDNADISDLQTNRDGSLFVIGGNVETKTTRANYTAAQTNTAIILTDNVIVVTAISVMADNANTVDVSVRIGFGSTTTPTDSNVILSHPGIAPGSGVVLGDGSGIIGAGLSGADLRITSEVPTSGSIDVVVTYHEING